MLEQISNSELTLDNIPPSEAPWRGITLFASHSTATRLAIPLKHAHELPTGPHREEDTHQVPCALFFEQVSSESCVNPFAGVSTFVEHDVIIGGTGRFADASGEFTIDGTFSLFTNSFVAELSGTIELD